MSKPVFMFMFLLYTAFGDVDIDFTLQEIQGDFVNNLHQDFTFQPDDDKVIVGIEGDHDCAGVEVLYTHDNGKYFHFDKDAWVAMTGDTSVGGRRKIYMRGVSRRWEGDVTVWDNDNGIHGRRSSGGGSDEWEAGDMIFLSETCVNTDRRWKFTTSTSPDLKCNPLSWTSLKNEYDGSLDYTCPENQALAALESTWGPNSRDRRWRFRCCDISSPSAGVARYRIESVTDEPYLNDFDENFSMTCNRNSVVVGLGSYHDNITEDRRWKVRCGLVIANEQRVDLSYAPTLTRDRYVVGGYGSDSSSLRITTDFKLAVSYHASSSTSGCTNLGGCTTEAGGLDACKRRCALDAECNTFSFCSAEAASTGTDCWQENRCCPQSCDLSNGVKTQAIGNGWDIYVGDVPVCFKSGAVYEPLDGLLLGSLSVSSTAECQKKCSENDSCYKWSLTGTGCHLTTSQAYEVQSDHGIIGPKIGCYEGRETHAYVLVKTKDCELHGMEFITDREECIEAGNAVGITDGVSRNNPTEAGNRQKYCGTWEGVEYLHFNPESGFVGDYPSCPSGQPASYVLSDGSYNPNCCGKARTWCDHCSCGRSQCCESGQYVCEEGYSSQWESEHANQGVSTYPGVLYQNPNCGAQCDTKAKCDDMCKARGGSYFNWLERGSLFGCRCYTAEQRASITLEGTEWAMCASPRARVLETAGQDSNGGAIESYQICKASGWTAPSDAAFDFEMEGTPVVIDVGHNLDSGSKTVANVGNDLVCPSVVSRSNRVSLLGEEHFDDRFEVQVVYGKDGRKDLSVSHSDGGGWSVFLRVPCYYVGNHALLAGMISTYSDYHNDRQFKFYSASAPGLKCIPNPWTEYQNEFEGKVDFTCPDGHALSAVGSYHDDTTEDRRFRFRCCNVENDGYTIAGPPRQLGNTDTHLRVLGWTMSQGKVDVQCAHNEVMIGFTSEHVASAKDRRFNIKCGTLIRAAPDFDDCTEVMVTDVIVGTPVFDDDEVEHEATLESFQTDFNACGFHEVPETFVVTSSAEDTVEKSDTLELEKTLEDYFDYSATVETSFTYGQSVSADIETAILDATVEASYEYSVGASMTAGGGSSVGSRENTISETTNIKVTATAIDVTFNPKPFLWYTAIGTYYTRKVTVPVTLQTKCKRKDGEYKFENIEASYVTSGSTQISIRYFDRTNECPQSYYRNCECVPNLASDYVDSGFDNCPVHPVFDGNPGCYVYKGREDRANPTCTNGMALGTAAPNAGIEVGPSNYDYPVDGVAFGWSYLPCDGLQYYPGDQKYSGPSFDDLVIRQNGKHCRYGKGGTLSQDAYVSRNNAIVACYKMNEENPNTCLGVYDSECDSIGEFHLCSTQVELGESAGGDNPSCVYTMQDLEPNEAFSPFSETPQLYYSMPSEEKEKEDSNLITVGVVTKAPEKSKNTQGLSKKKRKMLKKRLQKREGELEDARNNDELTKEEKQALKAKLKKSIKKIKGKLNRGKKSAEKDTTLEEKIDLDEWRKVKRNGDHSMASVKMDFPTEEESAETRQRKDAETVEGRRRKDAETVEGRRRKDPETVEGRRRKDPETVEGRRRKDPETVEGRRRKDPETVEGRRRKVTTVTLRRL